MSQNLKSARGNPSQPELFDGSPEVHPQEYERVAQLITANKSGQAVDIAKDVHKRRRSAQSEALLLDAYSARLASLVERKLDREALALMDLVRERYPSARERLVQWAAVFAARSGDLSALLEPLNDPSLPAEKQAAIAASVRRDVCDLRGLAECQTLLPEHPLRVAAIALHKAFEAVTTGPVGDAAIELPEVSRSSPLAPWKMLVRAIAAYYRRDDGHCEKCLAAIEPGSAPARLVPALRVLIHQAQTLTPAGTTLVNQAAGDLDSLRAILKRLDSALDRRKATPILEEIRNAVAACRQVEPTLLDRLKQHISIRALLAGVKAESVTAAMGGPSLKNAHFWRLRARAHEEDKSGPMAIGAACSAWEEFRKHAVREGWFSTQGPEVATLYLHMADLLHLLGAEDLEDVLQSYRRHFDCHADSYRGQPPEIRALMPARKNGNFYFLSPTLVLERACEADPCAENFQRWLQSVQDSDETGDIVAERWLAARPDDIAPMLHLMKSAEERNALQKAFKFMERAEQIDGLNAEVRRARLRLLVSMAVRHMREKKPKLAEKELCQIEALPQAQQGDRPAFTAALRFVWSLLRDNQPEAAAAQAEVERLMGDSITAYLLLLEVERWCGRRSSALGNAQPPTGPLFAAVGRVCALGDDMGMSYKLAAGMAEQMMKELAAGRISANPRALAALGETAMREGNFPLAYAIAGAGLSQGADGHARFLLLRARSLPMWEPDRRSGCLAAAAELARRHHDFELLKRIGECRTESLAWLDEDGPAPAAPDSEEIRRLVEREMTERTFPPFRPPALPNSQFDGSGEDECQCPECTAARGELPPELMEMVEMLGPEAVARAMAEMLGVGGKKKRRRRSVNDSEFF